MIEYEVFAAKEEERKQIEQEEHNLIRSEIKKLINKKQLASVAYGLPKVAQSHVDYRQELGVKQIEKLNDLILRVYKHPSDYN